jgi:prephenate dehydrogenase
VIDGRAAIIGLGLIGGSFAAALKRAGMVVHGFDVDADRSRFALERELINMAAAGVEEAAADADVVVLAMPVLAIVRELPEIERVARPEALIIDVGSVKKPVVEAMANLRHPGRAVGGHPISGNERSGPGAASADMFDGQTFVLCPSKETSDESLRRADRLVGALGAEITTLDADEHDRILARTSHVPQFVSTALAAGLRPSDQGFFGSGLKDTIRLARSDARIWRDVALANGSNIAHGLRSFAADLQRMAERIDEGDGEYVETMMLRGSEGSLLALGPVV